MEDENIVILRLYSGEMVIGRDTSSAGLSAETRVGYDLEDPRSIIMVPTMRGDVHIAMKPVCAPFSVKRLEKRLTVPFGQVMFMLSQPEIDKELLNGYKSEISGIKIASTADAMALAADKMEKGGGEFVLQ